MNKKLCALFMIVFILCMPIAFAQATIVEVNVYGIDKTNGYNREIGDQTTVEALVHIDGDDLITADQVKIEDIDFQSCIDEGGNKFRCKYEEEQGFSEVKSYPFTVTLYGDSGVSVATKSASLTYDNLNPEIEDVNIKQVGNDVKATFKLTDKACEDESCAGKCSGFKQIEFVGVKKVDLNATGCSYTGTEVLELDSGTYALTLNVYDGVGNLGSYTSESFTIDKTLPKIETDQAQLIKDGKEISYIGQNGLSKVDVIVYVEENNIQEVVGDLSPLNKITHYKVKYENLPAVCTDLGGVYSCKWASLNLMPESASGSLDIKIKDKSGNEVIQAVSYSLELDDVKPSVVSIRTECNGGLCYLREKNNTIQMQINEKDSGFNRGFWINGQKKYFVALNLGQLSSKYSKEWADECKEEEGNWNCYWYNIDVGKGHGNFVKISVADGSQDDAGNTFDSVAETEFMVDKKAPIKKELSIDSGAFLGYVMQAEGLNVKLTLTEDSPVKAVGRFGGVVNEGKEYPVDCAKTAESEYVCEWVKVGSVVPGPMQDAEFSIVATDFSGNSVIFNETVDIVEAEGLPKAYWRWEGNLITRPSAVSKDTLFRAQRVHFLLPLKSAVKKIKVVDAKLTGCQTNTGFELNERVVVTPSGIFASGTTSQGLDTSFGSITADCKLQIVSVIDRTRIAQPQEIPVKLSVPIVDSKAGSIGDTVKNKINKAREEAKMSGILGKLEKIYNIAEKVCAGVKIVTTVTDLFQKFSIGPAKGCDAMCAASPAACQGCKRAINIPGDKANTFNKKMNKFFKKFCGYMSCEQGSFGPEFSKTYNSMTGTEAKPGMWPKNPKDNLLLSAVMGCIPGIIYNLKKRKHIQCMYVDCLQNQVPNGVPVAFCDTQVGYQECRFVYGQVFGAIPYSHIVKKYGDTFQNLFHDPVSLVMGIGSYFCSRPSATQSAICRNLFSSPILKSAMQDWEALKNNFNLLDEFDKSGNPCKRVGLE